MTLPPKWTQFHAARHHDRIEVTIHFDRWIRVGIGETMNDAIHDSLTRHPIAMGADAPMLMDVSKLYGESDGAA